MSSTVREQVLADMKIAGLAPSTQGEYLRVMERFIQRTWVTPEQATEEQVATYLRAQVEHGLSQGAFKVVRFGLQFLFQNTLGRQWAVFKKSAEPLSGSVSRRRRRMTSAAD